MVPALNAGCCAGLGMTGIGVSVTQVSKQTEVQSVSSTNPAGSERTVDKVCHFVAAAFQIGRMLSFWKNDSSVSG